MRILEMRHLKKSNCIYKLHCAFVFTHSELFPHLFRLFSNPITPTYGTINVFRINTDPGRGELVLRMEILLVASYSLFISPVTLGSS